MDVAAILVAFGLLAAPALLLLRQALRTGHMQEALAAVYFLGAAVGLSCRFWGVSLYDSDLALSFSLNSVGHMCFAIGTCSMALFTWRVFHPDRPAARLFAGLTIVTIMGTTLHLFIIGGVLAEDSMSMAAANAARIVPTAWACFESFRYWRTMRKRGALGLAHPVVTNRFALWAVWTAMLSILPLMALVFRFIAMILIDPAEDVVKEFERLSYFLVWLRVTAVIFAPIAATALCLSFFPPRWYIDRLQAMAPDKMPA